MVDVTTAMAENRSDSEIHSTLTRDNIIVITYVYISFLIFSVIGSFSVLVVSLFNWRNLHKQRQVLVQLALADFLASLVLLSITISNIIPAKYNCDLCFYGLPLALVFYVLSFVLVIIYALKSKNVFLGWRTRPSDSEDVQRENTPEIFYSVLLWSFAIVMYLIYAGIITSMKNLANSKKSDPNSKLKPDICNSCILFLHVPNDGCPRIDTRPQSPVYYVLFFILFAVLLSCTVIYKKVSKWQQGQQQQQLGLFPVEGDGQSWKRFKQEKCTPCKRLMVIIFCWGPALLLFVLVWTPIQQSNLYPLYIIQASTVSLQGFLNSLVYGWRRSNFREAVLGERTPLLPYNHVPFFEDSLRTTVC
ncbi:hypothetical protein WMY93_023434 [Mugilogobius chulae]|uniref:G-protein coupled receptors family 1 profile domain-containing protein n=1 Tax=Mugilogobius chulae TaxID=88201 RepID=A0AAW0N5Q7_9GOBI